MQNLSKADGRRRCIKYDAVTLRDVMTNFEEYDGPTLASTDLERRIAVIIALEQLVWPIGEILFTDLVAINFDNSEIKTFSNSCHPLWGVLSVRYILINILLLAF
jgi:hypothetical protein